MKGNSYIFFLLVIASPLFAQYKPRTDTHHAPDKLIVKLKAHLTKNSMLKAQTIAQLKNASYVSKITPIFPQDHTPQSLPNSSAYFANFYELQIKQGETIESVSKRLYDSNLVEDVEKIGYYKSLAPALPPTPPPFLPNDELYLKGRLWGHEKAKIYDSWELSKGDTNIVIGIIDDYVETNPSRMHEEFVGQMQYNRKERYGIPNLDDDGNGFVDDSLGYDFAEGNFKYTYWHGTTVAGISSAKVNNRVGVAGIGFNCRFMPIKVIPDPSRGEMLSINLVRAIRYAADNGCQIINLSLRKEYTIFSQLEQDVIDYATRKGALVVAAAGNELGEYDLYPASYNHVLSVVASNVTDRIIGSNSNFIDIAAPGIDVWTTHIQPFPDNYRMHYGSSFAAPFVAGAAGLVKARFPDFTPLQIAEQLRATADDIYGVKENQDFVEKFGKGRINVLKALQGRNVAQSVKAQNRKFKNKFGDYAFYEDTVTIVCDFVNYLKPSTSALKATLSSQSPYVTIVKNTVQIGALKTLDSLSNEKNPFVIYLKPETPPSTVIKFRIGYEDGEYADYQYFTITTSPNYLDMYPNDLSLSIAADGRVGMVGQSGKDGIGILQQGRQMLADAGLMISTGRSINLPFNVANSVVINNATRANDFTAIKHSKFISKDLQSITASSTFADAEKIGLEIKQTVKGRINTPHQQYVLIEYEIENKSGTPIDTLSVGLFADWDIDGGKANLADWDEKGKFGYVFKRDVANYLGIKVISDAPQYYPIDKNSNDGKINFGDGFSETEKFITLNHALEKKKAGYENSFNSDVAHVVSAKITNLAHGQRKKMTFAILAGASLGDLQAAAAQAEIMANPNSSKGKKPVVSPLVCKDKTMYIRPTNGKTFRFYEASNLKSPKVEGEKLEVNLADTAKTFYISNVDSLVESDLLKYQFKVHEAKASFVSIDSLNIVDSATIYFYDKSVKPVKWAWDFGYKTAIDTLQNPKHQFDSVGLYKVTLTITDSSGCETSFSKNIRVVRLVRSPIPALYDYDIFACRTAPSIITPFNGKTFKFYTSLPLRNPVHQGRFFSLTDLSVKQVYITSIDSSFESLPATVTIKRGNLKANFDYSPMADTIVNNEINFTDRSTSSAAIVKWEWYFGDSASIDKNRHPTRRFSKQGVYKVILRVTDFTGCTDTISKFFKIGNKGLKPIVAHQVVCKGQVATFAPTNGTKFNFYTALPLSNPIFQGQNYSFVPSETQKLYITSVDSILESDAQVVEVVVNEALADFDAPNEILLYRNNNLASFSDLSKNAVSWQWNFGDGSPIVTVKNPVYLYKKQGEYTVTLSITDIYGCTAHTSKKIKIINRANPPQIASSMMICKNAEVILKPKGGIKFRFYEIYPSSLVAFTGNTWNLGKIRQNKTYYVTSIDSLHESEASKIDIKIDEISADFEIIFPAESAFVGDTISFNPLSTNAIAWEWTIGVGNAIFRRNPSHIYRIAGSYNIKLNIGNATGCTASLTKTIIVRERTNIPANARIYLYPNPTEGEVRVEISTLKPTPVYVELYNVLGQRLDSFTQEMVKNEIYRYSLTGRNKGIYLLRFTFDGETFMKKVIYE
jgi:PKD repeat protein